MSDAEISSILESDPGNPEFADYANELRHGGKLSDALLVCLRGLSANPACQRGRLILARTYVDLKLIPFALRELEQLQAEMPQNQLIPRLLSTIDPGHKAQASSVEPGSTDSPEAETIAEAEFGFDELDLIEEDHRNKK